MRIKRFTAPTVRQAIDGVRQELGAEAVILSSARGRNGVEIVAAIDYDETLLAGYMGSNARDGGASAGLAMTTGEVKSPPAALGQENAVSNRGTTLSGAGDPPLRTGRWQPGPAKQIRRSEPPIKSGRSRPRAASVGDRRPAEHRGTYSDIDVVTKPDAFKPRDPRLDDVTAELRSLRTLMEQQLSGLAWGELARTQPLRTGLMERLLRVGLSPSLCSEVARKVSMGPASQANWSGALRLLQQALIIGDDDILAGGGVVALVGPTGVGKTTTVAKLAAQYTLRHGQGTVGLITTDSRRIGAQEQLRGFGQILDMPVRYASGRRDLRELLQLYSHKSLVLIDTEGMSQRDKRLPDRLALLKGAGEHVRMYLLLAANAQLSVLREVVRAVKSHGVDGCIVSKVDESTALGGVISVLIEHKLPVLYLTTGQRVPHDICAARAEDLVTIGTTSAEMHQPQKVGEEALALAFGKLTADAVN